MSEAGKGGGEREEEGVERMEGEGGGGEDEGEGARRKRASLEEHATLNPKH